MHRLKTIFHAYILLLSAVLVYTLSPGLLVTDEGAYALMAKSLAVDGTFQIWNGLNETVSSELKIPATVFVANNEEVRLYGIPAPLYPVIAWPFYRVFGLWGLHLMNVLGFVWVTYLIYRLYLLLFKDERAAVASAVLYSFGSYALQYSGMVLPHMISAAFVLTSFYVVVRCFVRDSGATADLFFAGLLSGAAVGIRYPNGGFSLLLAAFIFHYLRGGLQPFISGFLLSVLPILVFNIYVFGSIIETGYPISTLTLLMFALPTLLVIAFWGRISARLGDFSGMMSWPWRRMLLAAAVLVSVCVLVKPVGLVPVYFFAKVFYMDAMPYGVSPTVYKRALLQSAPWLALSFLAPLFMFRRKIDRGIILLVAAAALFEPLLFSLAYGHGGSDETFGMRYFLDSLPFVVVSAVYAGSQLYSGISRRAAAAYAALSVVLALSMAFNNDVYSGFFFRVLPVAFSLILICLGVMVSRTRRYYGAFMLALFLSVSYGASVAFSDQYIISKWRAGYNDASLSLMSQVKDGSALFYLRKEEAVTLDYVKLYRDVRIVAASADGGRDTARLVRFYGSRGVPIYINALSSTNWANRTHEYAVANNITRVEILHWY